MGSNLKNAEFGKHLVIRAPNWVGDLVMATPVLEAALDSGFERVTILVRGHLAGVLAGGRLAERVVALEKGANEVQVYRELKPDVVVLLTSSFGAALRVWRARVPVRIGGSQHRRGLLLTHKLKPATVNGRRAATATANLLRDVGALAGLLPDSIHPVLHVTAAEEQRALGLRTAAGLAANESFGLCCPGAAFGAAKLWPPSRFAETIVELRRRHGWRTIVTGGPGEERLMDAVAAAAGDAAISISGEARDLGSLKALVQGAELLLVGDSGPRWYAAAFDVPCVSVMGPNSPALTATSLEHCEVVRRTDLACSPCMERVCPLEHHACMVELPSVDVIDAAERVLAGR